MKSLHQMKWNVNSEHHVFSMVEKRKITSFCHVKFCEHPPKNRRSRSDDPNLRGQEDDRGYVNDQYKQLFHHKSEGSQGKQVSDLSPRVLRKMSSPSPGPFRRKMKDQLRWTGSYINASNTVLSKLTRSFQTSIIGPGRLVRESALPPPGPPGPILRGDQRVQRPYHRLLLRHRHLPPL